MKKYQQKKLFIIQSYKSFFYRREEVHDFEKKDER